MTRYGMIKMVGKAREIWEYDSFKAAMQSIIENSNRATVSKSTRKNYIGALKQFLQFVNGEEGLTTRIDPDNLVEEAQSDPEKAKKKIKLFFLWLQGEPIEGYKQREEKMRQTSAFVRAYAQIKGFYTNNNIVFGKWKSPSLADMKKEAIENDVSTPFFKHDKRRKIFLDRGLLKQFLANLKLRDQTIFLAELSSSHDSGDLFQLTVGDIRKQKDRERFYWEGQRNKTGVRFKTFFSAEATDFIRRYVEQERKGVKDSDPLFMTSVWRGQKRKMDAAVISGVFLVAAKKMGVKVDNGYQNPFRPKRLRHIFRTACTHALIDEGYINVFMGHRTSVSKEYLEKDITILELEYSKAEPYLTVYGVGGTEGLEKLETELSEVKSRYFDLQEKVNNLTENFTKNVEVVARDLFQRWLKELYGEEQGAIKEKEEWKEEKAKEEYPSPQKAEPKKISEKSIKIEKSGTEEKPKQKTFREEILGEGN